MYKPLDIAIMDHCLRKLLEETSKGYFNTVINLIEADKSILNTNNATSIVIECCRIFTVKNSSCSVREQDLLKLLTKCVQCIERLSAERSLSYIRSLFYITKYCFEKNNMEMMLQLVPIILSDFIYYDDNEIKKVYNSIWSLFHNAISKISRKNFAKTDCLYLDMCLSALKIYRIHFSNSILVANLAASYLKTPKCYEADPEIQCGFYKQILLVIKIPSSERNDEFYTATTRVIEIGIRNLFTCSNFSKIREFVDDYKLYVDEIVSEKMYLEMGNVLHAAAQCVIEIKNESNSALLKKFENCLNSLKHYCTSFDGVTQIPFVCNILSNIFEHLIEYYSNVPCSVWTARIEESIQMVIFKILDILAQVFTKNKIKCKFCKNDCDNGAGLFRSVNTIRLIGRVMKICLVNNMEISPAISNQVLYYLEHCCTQISTLKTNNCGSWLSAWSEIGTLIYTIAIKLYAIKDSTTSKYFILLTKNLLKLEGSNSTIFKFDALATCLKCLSDIYKDTYDYKKALIYISLAIVLRPNLLGWSIKQWICIKAEKRENEVDPSLQELTITCVLKENQAEITNIYPQAQTCLNHTEQLLIEELKCYKKIWPSRISMLTVLKKIYEKCDLTTTVKALVTTWSSTISAHNGLFELLTEILDRFEKEICSSEFVLENQLYLAHLYALRYYALITETRMNNFKEINNASENTTNQKNNKYEFILLSSNLKLNGHTKIDQYLRKSLNLFKKCFSNLIKPHVIDLLKECDVLNVVANIAFEFRLYCDSLQSINAWFLCLDIARLLENPIFMLKSIGFLIENSSLGVDAIKKLLTESELLVERVQILNTNDAYETLTTFYINKSTMYYGNTKFQHGFDCYKKAALVFSNIPIEGQNEIIRSRLDFLHVKYLQLPCQLKIDDHEVYSLQKFSQVCRKISLFMKEQGYISSYGLAILFEINCMLIHMYKWMFLPREVRCYSRDLVVLSQQLVIPLRTAIIISYLAYSDLQSTRTDDCQVKIDDLSDILCLATNKHCTVKQNEIVCEKSRWENNDVGELTENFAGILLDCPVSTREQALQGSPTLLKSFKMPSILSHVSECDCFYCLSVEYQNLVITLMHLDAEHYILMSNTTAANYCFNAALQLYTRFTSETNNFKTKVTKCISCYPFFDLKDILCQSHCTALLGYARHLFRNDLLKAKCLFKDLINLISENMYENLYLYNEIHLDYAVMMMSSIEESKPRGKETDNQLTVDDALNCVKTPESKRSKVVFYNTYSPNPESPPKRTIRKIKCDFSEVKEKKATKPNKEKFVNVPPGSVTPGCSTELYVPPTIQTEKKKRNILTEIPVLDLSDKNQKNDTILVPLSPNAYTPNAIKASVGLESRRKLLTKKLKSETTKKRIVEDEMCVSDVSDTKNNVCKNLLSELCAADKKSVYKKGEKKKTVSNGDCVEQTKRVTRATARNKK